MPSKSKHFTEEIKVAGNQLVDRVRELIKEGNARRVTIKRGDVVYMEIPLSVGIGGAMATIWLAPALAAVGAIAALVSDVELVVERDGPIAGDEEGVVEVEPEE
jgi:hypothetical protein